MGNRAIITTEERDLGLYLHWNGGRDSVEAFLKYCDLRGFRPPSSDCYGWARLCQVIGNFFGGDLSLGITKYTNDNDMRECAWDNGVYVISGWEITDRVLPEWEGFSERRNYDLVEMLCDIDHAQPEKDRLGDDFITQKVMA